MLTAVVLELHPDRPVRVPVSHGSLAYAAALDALGRLSPSLAQALHDGVSRKPLTVGPLAGRSRQAGHDLVLSPEHTYRWRLTGLNSLVSSQLARLTPDLGKVRIGEAVFAITSVRTSPEVDQEAGQDSYESLWIRGMKDPATSPITFRFVTPTTFREGRFEQPFPLPRWLFGSLLRTWNTFAPVPIGECRNLIETGLLLSNWKGETRRIEGGGYQTVGFLGKFTYRARKLPLEMAHIVNVLSEYAFYAGAGWQTTQGMGQVRPERRGGPTRP